MTTTIIIAGLSSFIGALIGSMLGSRLAWRRDFVTREEAIKLARAIDEQRRCLEALRLGLRH